MFGLGKCPSYRETKKMTDERQGPSLGVWFREVYIFKRVKEKGMKNGRDHL